MSAHEPSRESLERWEFTGAHWRTIFLSDVLVVVELRTCTGEPLERQESTDPELIAYVRSRPDTAVSGAPSSMQRSDRG